MHPCSVSGPSHCITNYFMRGPITQRWCCWRFPRKQGEHRMDIRWLKIGILGLALSAIPVMAQDRPQDEKAGTQNGSASTQASPDNGNANTGANANESRDQMNSSEMRSDQKDTTDRKDASGANAPSDTGRNQAAESRASDQNGTQKASSSGSGYGLWGLLGLLGLLGLGGRGRRARGDVEVIDRDRESRDIRRIA